MSLRRFAFILASGLVLSCAQRHPLASPIYQLAELNTEQIRALDREKTVILLPGGILEEHGPYLPSYTDGYMNERLTNDLAKAIASRPGWSTVIFPVVPLARRANEVGQVPFPVPAIRPETLCAVYMDLATEFGEQGFRWLFLIHSHGAPAHNQAPTMRVSTSRDIRRTDDSSGWIDTGRDPAVEVMRANTTEGSTEEDCLSMTPGCSKPTERWRYGRSGTVASAASTSVTARELSDVFELPRVRLAGLLRTFRYASSS